MTRSSFLEKGKFFFFSKTSISALGPTQLTVEWVPVALSLGVKRPGREVNHFLVVPRLRMKKTYISFLPIRFIGISRRHFNSSLYGFDGGRLAKGVILFSELRESSNFDIARIFM